MRGSDWLTWPLRGSVMLATMGRKLYETLLGSFRQTVSPVGHRSDCFLHRLQTNKKYDEYSVLLNIEEWNTSVAILFSIRRCRIFYQLKFETGPMFLFLFFFFRKICRILSFEDRFYFNLLL